MAMEIAGHEFWSADGKTIWYDLQTPQGRGLLPRRLQPRDRRAHAGITSSATSGRSISTSAADGTLFCGDGGDPGQVAKAPDGRWIYLFRPELQRIDAERGQRR